MRIVERFFEWIAFIAICIVIPCFLLVLLVHGLGVAQGFTAPVIHWTVWSFRMALMGGMIVSTVVAVLGWLYFVLPGLIGRALGCIARDQSN